MNQVAQRYGRAAFELAQKNSSSQQVMDELSIVQKLLETNKDLKTLVFSKRFGAASLQSVFEAICQVFNFSDLTQKFLTFLASKNRISSFSKIFQDFSGRWLKEQGIVRVLLTTAVPLTKTQLQVLSKELEAHLNKKVLIEPIVSEDILGGILIQVNSILMDGSLRTKLKRLNDVIKGV